MRKGSGGGNYTAGFADNAFDYPAIGIIYLGGAVAGAPFFILEKVFYDFPRYLLEFDTETVP